MASFKEAFAAARKKQGPGGIFTWNGKKYTTDRADDKKPGKKTSAPKKSIRPKASPRDKAPYADSEAPKQNKHVSTKTTLKRLTEQDRFEREKDRLVKEEYERVKKKQKPLGSNIYTSAR